MILTIRGKISWYSSWKLKGEIDEVTEQGSVFSEFSLALAGSLSFSAAAFFRIDLSSFC